MAIHFLKGRHVFFIQSKDMVYVVYPLTFISAKITKKGVNFCYSLCPEISVP
jgi:hypothetical protein